MRQAERARRTRHVSGRRRSNPNRHETVEHCSMQYTNHSHSHATRKIPWTEDVAQLDQVIWSRQRMSHSADGRSTTPAFSTHYVLPTESPTTSQQEPRTTKSTCKKRILHTCSHPLPASTADCINEASTGSDGGCCAPTLLACDETQQP